MTHWYRGSLLPPPDIDGDDDAAAADPPKSCLLDRNLFVGDRTNATTAWYDHPGADEIDIQVTLFVTRPPRISYVLAWCAGTYFTEQPWVVSTHDGLVLLSIAFSRSRARWAEYFIYQPGSGHGGAASEPSLDLIPQPSGERLVDGYWNVGLIRSSDSHGGGYHMAALLMSEEAKGVFDLYVFSSETGAWTVKNPTVVLDNAAAVDFDDYMEDKVITLGGSSMAFVDCMKGILICDVLDESPELHFLPLPSAEQLCQPSPDAYPSKPHDVAIDVSGDGTMRIRFVKVVCPPLSSVWGWRADRWSTTAMATSPWRQLEDWHNDSTVHDTGLSVPGSVDLAGLLDLSDLGSLFIEKPMLSLHEDNVVCFMAKRDITERQVRVIAVDMVKKELQGVNHLEVRRATTLFYSTISSHLNNVASSTGENGGLKRPGEWLGLYPRKKQFKAASSINGEQEQGVMRTHDGDDDMDLDLE